MSGWDFASSCSCASSPAASHRSTRTTTWRSWLCRCSKRSYSSGGASRSADLLAAGRPGAGRRLESVVALLVVSPQLPSNLASGMGDRVDVDISVALPHGVGQVAKVVDHLRTG